MCSGLVNSSCVYKDNRSVYYLLDVKHQSNIIIKSEIFSLVHTARFLNNLHQECTRSTDWKVN